MGRARRHAVRWGVLAAAGALLFVAGCSAGGGDDSSSGGGSSGEMAAPAAAAPQRAADAAGGKADSGSAGAPAPDLPRALIRTAEMTVRVDDVSAAARSAQEFARTAGGTTSGDNRYGTGENARADLELKVAPGRLDGALEQFAGLGDEVRRTSSTQDVTEDVADIDVRVRSMQASIARVRAILARADKIGDVVAVEGELSRRTTELESLQTKQRALAGQTALATVTLHLVAKDVPLAAATERGGFLGGLEDGWNAFTSAVGWLLTALGALLPFLIVLVPLAYGVRWFLTRRRPAPTAPAPPAAPAA
jgi:Domain of unknown function (DUF4349)